MPVTEKTYPDWVQQYRTRGTTVKKKGDSYYLYKRTSKRVPGKKYPQPVDTFIGIITPDGVIESDKKKVSLTDIEVYEYGFSKAIWDLCTEEWKKLVGDGWEDVLRQIMKTWSPGSYLLREVSVPKTDISHHQFSSLMASLNRRIHDACGVSVKELDILKQVYLVVLDRQKVLSKISDAQREIAERAGIRLEVD